MTELAQATGYSGAAHPGLNENASYHRMIYEDRSTLHTFESFSPLFQELMEKFRSSGRSRFVMRILIRGDEEVHILTRFIAPLGGSVGFYPNFQKEIGNFSYVTIGINRPERNPRKEDINILVERNQRYISNIQKGLMDFDTFSVNKLHAFEREGFALTKSISPEELQKLWEPFGWSEDACKSLLHEDSSDFVLGVREKRKKLIATILYSHQPHTIEGNKVVNHGELTEAMTTEEYRGNGIMGILGTALHVQGILSGAYNIYGEYRAIGSDKPNPLQSLRFAIESGVEFHSPFPLINHVDIDDVSDTHNIGISVPAYPGNPEQLKSFFVGSLNPEKISPRIIETYGNALSL